MLRQLCHRLQFLRSNRSSEIIMAVTATSVRREQQITAPAVTLKRAARVLQFTPVRKKRRPSQKLLELRKDYDVEIHRILNKLAGVKATELAQKSGLCAKTIHRIRQGPSHGGTRWPRHDTLERLARCIGETYISVKTEYVPQVNELIDRLDKKVVD